MEGRGKVPGPVSPHPQHLSSLWLLGGGGYSVYLLGMFAGLLKNIQRLGDQGTHPKSRGTSNAEEMVATASGEEVTSIFVGDSGATQLRGGSPPARPGEPYLSGHYRQRRHSPQC